MVVTWMRRRSYTLWRFPMPNVVFRVSVSKCHSSRSQRWHLICAAYWPVHERDLKIAEKNRDCLFGTLMRLYRLWNATRSRTFSDVYFGSVLISVFHSILLTCITVVGPGTVFYFHWSPDRSISRWIDWLNDCLSYRLIDWLIDCKSVSQPINQAVWSINQLIVWSVDPVINWFID